MAGKKLESLIQCLRGAATIPLLSERQSEIVPQESDQEVVGASMGIPVPRTGAKGKVRSVEGRVPRRSLAKRLEIDAVPAGGDVTRQDEGICAAAMTALAQEDDQAREGQARASAGAQGLSRRMDRVGRRHAREQRRLQGLRRAGAGLTPQCRRKRVQCVGVQDGPVRQGVRDGIGLDGPDPRR